MVFTVWFTGLPGSGKTAISSRTAAILKKKGFKIKVLQLDEIRRFITPNPKYTQEERDIVYFSLVYMAKLLNECGMNVFIDATANKRKYRDKAREVIQNFAEVYIKCPIEVCIERESYRKAIFSPKDIYKKSKQPDATVPGVNVPYESPLNPEIEIESNITTLRQSVYTAVEGILSIFDKHENQRT